MKKLLKITLTLVITIILLTGIIAPEILLGTPASPAVGNWYQQFMPNLNNMPLSDICFADSITGYAITGDHTPNDTNFILKTSDGGNSWNIIYRSYRNHLRIQLLNKDTVFICGGFNVTNGELVLTTNGGINWNNVNTPNTIWFDDMNVLNINTIYLVQGGSLDGGVYFTSNGGTNWVQQYSAGSQNPEKIYMYNARIGFISDQSGSSSIRKTTNGGLNWVMNLPGEYFFDMNFTDSLTGWKCMPGVIAGDSCVKITTNGGLSWTKQTLPSGGIVTAPVISKFSFVNSDTIYGVGSAAFYGGGQFRGIIFRTINGGVNWLFQIPDTSIHIPNYFSVQFVNGKKGWAYSGSQGGIHTINGGDTLWVTDVKQIGTVIPKAYQLYQNFPNPFNPATNIRYQLPKTGYIILQIFDITGKEIALLVNQKQTAGTYEVNWGGNRYSTGIYFYSLLIDGKMIDTKKMILIK